MDAAAALETCCHSIDTNRNIEPNTVKAAPRWEANFEGKGLISRSAIEDSEPFSSVSVCQPGNVDRTRIDRNEKATPMILGNC